MVLKKKVKVFFEKIWKFQKLALPLQPLSASKTGRWFSKKMLKIFFQKDLEVWKSCLTFATAFRF